MTSDFASLNPLNPILLTKPAFGQAPPHISSSRSLDRNFGEHVQPLDGGEIIAVASRAQA